MLTACVTEFWDGHARTRCGQLRSWPGALGGRDGVAGLSLPNHLSHHANLVFPIHSAHRNTHATPC
jgi:hypothetical protein